MGEPHGRARHPGGPWPAVTRRFSAERMRCAVAGVAWCLLIAMLATRAGADPAALDLDSPYAPGDTVLVERVLSTDLSEVSTVNGEIASTGRERVSNRYVFLQKVLSVWPDGRLKAVRRTYRVATITRRREGRAPVVTVKALQGRTVTITGSEGIARLEAPPGLDVEDTESLYQALSDDFERVVLTGRRKIGDTWPAPPVVDLVIMFHAACKGTSRFVGMADYRGMRCARIVMNESVKGVNQRGAQVAHDGVVTVYWSQILGRAIAATAQGRLKIESTTRQGSDILRTTREGTARVDRLLTWTTVGGKRSKSR